MNGIAFPRQKVDQNLQIKTDITNCNFYPCPSNTIQHSLETSKAGTYTKCDRTFMAVSIDPKVSIVRPILFLNFIKVP